MPEFITAILNNRITNIDKIKFYVAYAKQKKLEVLPPDINKSETYFSVENDKLRFGLAALKNVGINVCDSIVEEREKNGEFKSLEDLISRIDPAVVNKRWVEAMILSGAFDCFGVARSQMRNVFELILERNAKDKRNQAGGQMTMFGLEIGVDVGFDKVSFVGSIIYFQLFKHFCINISMRYKRTFKNNDYAEQIRLFNISGRRKRII